MANLGFEEGFEKYSVDIAPVLYQKRWIYNHTTPTKGEAATAQQPQDFPFGFPQQHRGVGAPMQDSAIYAVTISRNSW